MRKFKMESSFAGTEISMEIKGQYKVVATVYSRLGDDVRRELCELFTKAPKLEENVSIMQEALEEIQAQMKEHNEVQRGNSKVHFCYHKARAALERLKP